MADEETVTPPEGGEGTPPQGGQPEGQQPAGEPEGKPEGAEPDGNATGAPEAYSDFDLPEGVELDSGLIEQASPIFKEMGLSQAQAQQLVSLYADQQRASFESQVESFNQTTQQWLDEAKADKDLGGEKFDENVAAAKTALAKFGTPELAQLLNDTGVGNHPEIIRVFSKVGALLNEDVPGSGGGNVSEKADRASILYGTS